MEPKKPKALEEGICQAKTSVDSGMTSETAYAYGFLHGARWASAIGGYMLKINAGEDLDLKELAWEISQIADRENPHLP